MAILHKVCKFFISLLILSQLSCCCMRQSHSGEESEPEVKRPYCEATEWSEDDTSCDEEFPSEIYKDEYSIDNTTQYQRVCCKPGTTGETQHLLAAKNCRATECLPSNATSDNNLCSSLPTRYINGFKLIYEEVAKDPCTTSEHKGHVSLCCRRNAVEQVIISLLGAEKNEFPHQVRIQPVGCGGTIYNKNFIITAAHCVVNFDNGKVDPSEASYIIAGTNIEDMDVNSEEYIYKIENIMVHKKFSLLASNPKNERSNPDPRYLNDIALLELDRDLIFSKKVKALELAPPDFNPFKYANKVVTVGWGTTETMQGATYLSKTNLLLRKDSRCFKPGQVHEEYGRYEKQLLCVGGIMDGTISLTAGSGDSGGPAVCRSADGNPVLCGITSFGGLDEDCQENADEDNCIPSVYAEASYFRHWIIKRAGPQDPNTFIKYQLYGREVVDEEYQHQVHITTDKGYACGGTLIKPDVVLTAAHCVYEFKGRRLKLKENLSVNVGIKDLKTPGESIKVKAARRLKRFRRLGTAVARMRHKDRSIRSDEFYKNDLAVLLLETNTSIKKELLPSISNRSACSYKEAVETTFPRDFGGSSRMVERQLNLIKHNDCMRRMKLVRKTQVDIKLKNDYVCGVEKYSGGSTCDVEVGGGLMCAAKNGNSVLCGIQIIRLCIFSVPNLYIDVSVHRDWIERSILEMNRKLIRTETEPNKSEEHT